MKKRTPFITKTVLIIGLLMAVSLLAAACSRGRRGPITGRVYTYNQNLQRYPAAYYREVAEEYVRINPDREWVRSHIADRTLAEGMTQREVRLSWGEPQRVKRVPGTTRETWELIGKTLYFDDGILQKVEP